jgi:hypothetical protein
MVETEVKPKTIEDQVGELWELVGAIRDEVWEQKGHIRQVKGLVDAMRVHIPGPLYVPPTDDPFHYEAATSRTVEQNGLQVTSPAQCDGPAPEDAGPLIPGIGTRDVPPRYEERGDG